MGWVNDVAGVFDPMHHFIPKEYDASSEPRATPQERELLTTATQMYGQARAQEPLVRLRLAQLADPSKQIARARGRTNADVAQAAGGGTPFQRAMARAGALSKIGMMGENTIRQQALRERVGMTRFGSSILAGRNRELSDAASRTAELEAARARQTQDLTAAGANAVGTAVGAGLRSFSDPSRYGNNNRGWGSANSGYGGYATGFMDPNDTFIGSGPRQ